MVAAKRQQRPPILIEATNRRKDVFVEKPMAIVLDHANEAVRPVRRLTPRVDGGYAHTVASIMCFDAWTSGRRHLFDPVTRTTRAQ